MPALTPEEFLLAFHARHPGATSEAFAEGVTEDGRSSYELLADVPRPGDTVLDLGCGDGYLLERLVERGHSARNLIGVDMSAHELTCARARPALRGARLIECRAQSMPLDDASIDAALSHLAFMLMDEAETVAAELSRVLRPGARFSTVTGGGPGDDAGFELFLRCLREVYRRRDRLLPRLGGPRLRHGEGLRELFNPATGFGDRVEESVHLVRLDASAEVVWQRLATVYDLFVCTEDEVAEVRASFLAGAAKLAGDDGIVACGMNLRCVTVTRSAS